VHDQLLILEAPAAGVRLAICAVPLLSRDAARRHELENGSAAALAQGLAASLLLAATDRPDDPSRARVDLQLECNGPLKGMLIDADGHGAVRGLVRVNGLDRAGQRSEQPTRAQGEPGKGRERAERGDRAEAASEVGKLFSGASAAPGLQLASGSPPGTSATGLSRFDARPLLGGGGDGPAGLLSVLRAAPGAEELHRAMVPFAGHDLAAGISAFLRTDRRLAGELSLEVLYGPAEPLAAVAGAMVLPITEDEREVARELGERLRDGELHRLLASTDRQAPGNAHALAQAVSASLALGPLRLEGELRPRFSCRCSRERVVRALQTLGREELQRMAVEDGGAEATCDFCAQTYRIGGAELQDLAGAQ
jgi:molecular chaperone Hsp33